MNNAAAELKNWIPYKLTHSNTEVQCHWLNTFKKPFTEPFFNETIARCKSEFRTGSYLGSVSDLASMVEWSAGFEGVTPSAFIFHISRCGSTLASQLLGISNANISLAEVPLFDDLLRLPYKNSSYTRAEIGNFLKASVRFYSQQRLGTERHLFIKTDSWHILFYKQLRELYPDVPFILLYRRPDEVLNSHTILRGIQAVPGLIEPELFGFDPVEINNLSLDEYTAKVLECYLEQYIAIAKNDKLSLLVNYHDGIMPMINDIATFCNHHISEGNLYQMQQRSGYHSKHPDKVFTEEQTQNMPSFLERAFELYNIVDQASLSAKDTALQKQVI